MTDSYWFVPRSSNCKTGPIGLVTASKDTCWSGCAFAGKCYPDGGPMRIHWDRVTCGTRKMSFEDVCVCIAAQPDGKIWRWGDAGDLPGFGGTILADELGAICAANYGKRGYCFTHKPVTGYNPNALFNLKLIRSCNAATGGVSFTINLSAEGWKRADMLCELDIGPVVTVLPSTMPHDWKVSYTDAGRRIVRCPAERGTGCLQCVNCGGKKGPLCWRVDREYIVGFTSHGFAARQIDAIISELEMFG